MSILAGGILLGGEMPMPTPETPIVTPDSRVLRGELLGSLTLEAREHSRRVGLENWVLNNPMPRWLPLEHAGYRGVHFTNPVIISGDHQIGDFFYKPNSDEWRGIFEQGGTLFWDAWNLRAALGNENAFDLGEYNTGQEAYDSINDHDRDNYAFFDNGYFLQAGLGSYDGRVYVRDFDLGVNTSADALLATPNQPLSDTQSGYIVEVTQGNQKGTLLYHAFNASHTTVVIYSPDEVLGVLFSLYREAEGIGYYLRTLTDITLPATPVYKVSVYIAEN